MKAKHRHELKTNELAEWIANMPQWARDNLKIIVIVLVVVVAGVGAFYYFRYQRNVVSVREQLKHTDLTARQLAQDKIRIVDAQKRGGDIAFMLLQLAGDLETFARSSKDNHMAALALIKRGETLRAELHYRPQSVSQQQIADQIGRAKNSYNDVLEKAQSDPVLKGMANFGLGLCEEELGNFDKAKQIYRAIVENPELKGTTIVPQAKLRLETIPDYSKQVVFKVAPLVSPSATTTPRIPLRLPDVNVGNVTIPEVNFGVGPGDTNLVKEPLAGDDRAGTDLAESNFAAVNLPGS
jgi:tetratricopeptide (TPR) repeat protein